MTHDDPVERLAQDVRLSDPMLYDTLQAVRQLVQCVVPGASEAVKYGGIVFAAPGESATFCGVYAYQHHVSLEFPQGHALADPHGVLEGAGKSRRHIKFTSPADLDARQAKHYLAQAAPARGAAPQASPALSRP